MTRHINHVGNLGTRPVYSPDHPLPCQLDVYVSERRGLRIPTEEEWMQLKGFPSTWSPPLGVLHSLVQGPSLPEWTMVGAACHQALGELAQHDEVGHIPPRDVSTVKMSTPLPAPTVDTVDTGSYQEWAWSAPALGPHSSFQEDRLRRLHEVTAELGGPDLWILQGRDALIAHSRNYGPEGPKDLAILWWEWPREHWTELREGRR